jgi:hypothetical protein
MDRIIVKDANGSILFDLDYPTNSADNRFDLQDPSTYERILLRSPTQLVYVEIRDGGTDWWYELNCSQSGCLNVARHPGWVESNPT